MGPLDMILRGGSSSMSAAECSLEQDSELDDDSFSTMSDNVSLTSTDVDEEEDEIASSLKQASSNRTSRMAQSLMTAVRGGGGGVTHSKLKYTLFQKGDGSEKDPDGIPTRYLLMHPGNREMSKKSLQATIKWRKAHTFASPPHPKRKDSGWLLIALDCVLANKYHRLTTAIADLTSSPPMVEK